MTVSWYRKWRPKSFSDVIGQDHIVDILRRSIKMGMIGHAYLFTGPRGVGKTTTARLLAKSANCLGDVKMKNYDPCGKCKSCLAFENDAMVDVIEIDAASNRGIDDVRALRDTISFSPTVGAYKVYIIDEVHMLTKEAFNALLKTLEEPPSHVILILATTDVQKVPETILSRCQRFDFRPIAKDLLVDHLRKISEAENINLTPDGASLIAEYAYGSGRDAISQLQQLSVSAEAIDEELIKKFLGVTTEKEIDSIFISAISGDESSGLRILDDSITNGIDAEIIIKMVLRVISKSIKGQYKCSWLGDVTTSQLIKLSDSWAWALQQLKNHPEPYLVLATAYLDMSAILSKRVVANIERNAQEVLDVPAPVVVQTKSSKPDVVEVVHTLSSVTWNQSDGEKALWLKLIDEAKPFNHSLSALLRDARLLSIETGDPGYVNIGVTFPFHKDRIMEVKNRRIIEDLLKKIAGGTFMLKCSLITNNTSESNVESDDDLTTAATEVFME